MSTSAVPMSHYLVSRTEKTTPSGGSLSAFAFERAVVGNAATQIGHAQRQCSADCRVGGIGANRRRILRAGSPAQHATGFTATIALHDTNNKDKIVWTSESFGLMTRTIFKKLTPELFLDDWC